jgi:parallel beta helix pectate lyase-like protein
VSRTRLVASAVALLVVVGVAVFIAANGLEPTASGSPSPSYSPATGQPSGTPGSGAPTPSGEPSLPFGSGDPALDGAIWYPPQVDDGAYALVAAVDSSAENRQRADFVVRGTADDEINAALRSLAQTGGGQVKLLEGRYEIAAPIIIAGDGLALVGVNVGNAAGYAEAALGSQIVPADSFPDGEFLVQATSDSYGPLISLIHVDGANRAQGIDIEATRPTVTLNAVTQSSDVGLRFAGQTTGRRPYDGYVLFNRVFDGHGIGILHDQRAGDMLIEGNVVFRNGGDGFLSRSASQMYRLNHAYNNDGVGIRLVPGCVRTRLTSNKWEGNTLGGLSIEGGSGFTIIGDSFADNDGSADSSVAHIQLGVRGDTETRGVMLSDLAFGKGDDGNPYLIEFGSLAKDIHVGPVTSNGGYRISPFLEDPGSEVQFYGPIPDPIVNEGGG